MRTIFYNSDENRLRAGWRILVTTGLIFSLLIFSAVLLRSEWGFNIALAIIVLGIMYVASVAIDKRGFSDFGFVISRNWIKDFLAGNLFAILSMGFAVLSLYAAGWLTPIKQEIRFFEPEFVMGIISTFILMVAVSIWEEAYFRSYLITNIKEGLSFIRAGTHYPVIIAVILSSALFGIAHITNPNASWISAFNIAIAGVVLAYPYVATKSIAIPVGMHLSWNYFQGVVFGLPVSGQSLEPAILQFETSGPDIITGGSFGPEAGFIGLLSLLLMWSLSYVYIVSFYKK